MLLIQTEFLSRKLGIKSNSDNWHLFSDDSKRITKNSLYHSINGMLPLFIDGTSSNASNIMQRIGILESVGYDVGIVILHTSLDTAIKRAEDRSVKNNRVVDKEFIKKVFDNHNINVSFFKKKVDFVIEINNDDGELTDDTLTKIFVKTQSFYSSALENPVGIHILDELEKTQKRYIDQSSEIEPETLKSKINLWYKK